jgi:hypothetical protein
VLVGLSIKYYIDGSFTESKEVKNSKKDEVGENHDVELNIMGDSQE